MQRENLRGRPSRRLTHRILFDGKRAVGIEYSQAGQTHQAFADREVIVCGGSINSPQASAVVGRLAMPPISAEHDIPGGAARSRRGAATCRTTSTCGCRSSASSRSACTRPPRDWGDLPRGYAGCSDQERGGGSTNLFEVSGYIRYQRRGCPIRICSRASWRWPRATTAASPIPVMATRPTSISCGQPAVAACSSHPRIRIRRLQSSSTICKPSRIGARSSTACASPARSSARTRIRPLRRRRTQPRRQRCKQRRRGARLGARHRRDRVSPDQHLHHGHRRRRGWSTARSRSTHWRACASSMLPSCPGWSPPTPTRDDHDRREGG